MKNQANRYSLSALEPRILLSGEGALLDMVGDSSSAASPVPGISEIRIEEETFGESGDQLSTVFEGEHDVFEGMTEQKSEGGTESENGSQNGSDSDQESAPSAAAPEKENAVANRLLRSSRESAPRRLFSRRHAGRGAPRCRFSSVGRAHHS